MEHRNTLGLAIAGLAIGAGILLAGLAVGKAAYDLKASQRFVTVKGLAERDVDADLAIWPLSFEDAGNSLGELQHIIDGKRKVVRQFLLDEGFPGEEISQSPPQIRDFLAGMYYGGDRQQSRFRYAAQTTMTLRSAQVAKVKSCMERSGSLVGKGIALASESYGRNTEFLFTKLNDIKPAMIAEATQAARKAAEQFARDSGSEVGKIRSASQGLFSISSRDMNSPDKKTVRVVTTVEYYLIDR